MLQGSGRRVSAAISTAMFARERLCLWWRLPGSRTTSEDVRRNGCTLDTRFRHSLGHAHTYTHTLESHISISRLMRRFCSSFNCHFFEIHELKHHDRLPHFTNHYLAQWIRRAVPCMLPAKHKIDHVTSGFG